MWGESADKGSGLSPKRDCDEGKSMTKPDSRERPALNDIV